MMEKNKINDERINENILSINKSRQYIDVNITTGYCAKCLKNLDDIDKSDRKNITRDHNGNEFCCRECKKYFSRENKEDMDDIVKNWFGNGR